MRALADYHLGHLQQARQLTRRVQKAQETGKLYRRYLGHNPRRMPTSIYMARLEWIQGRSDDADQMLEEAFQCNDDLHLLGPSSVLGQAAIPIALWQGRDERARALAGQLLDYATRHEQGYFAPLIAAFSKVLDLRGVAPMHLHEGPVTAPNALTEDLFATFDPSFFRAPCLQRVERGEVG